MEKQNQTKHTLTQPSSMEAIRAMLARNEHVNRSALADAVCRSFGFLDSRGGPQTGGCSKALRELERAGDFVLPASPRPDATRRTATTSAMNCASRSGCSSSGPRAPLNH